MLAHLLFIKTLTNRWEKIYKMLMKQRSTREKIKLLKAILSLRVLTLTASNFPQEEFNKLKFIQA